MASAEQVERLADRLQDPVFRRSFSVDAEGALEAAGLKAAEIPVQLLNTLEGLSLLELGVIARVNRELAELKGDQAIIMMPL